jgi:hypothetical protein
MPVFHVTHSFANGVHGWVEQWYWQGPSWNAAAGAALALAKTRYSILGAGVTLYRARVTMPGVPRASITMNLSGTTTTVPADPPFVGAEIRLEGGTKGRHRRSYLLRGLPVGSLVNPRGPSRWAGPIASAAQVWLAQLLSGGWRMDVRHYESPRYRVLGIYPLAVPGSDYNLPDGGPLGPSPWESAVLVTLPEMPEIPSVDSAVTGPALVRIGLAKWSDLAAVAQTPVNGEWEIAGGVLGGLQYIGSAPTVGQYCGGGYAQVRQHGYLPITSALLTRQGTRHCGPVAVGAPPSGAVLTATGVGLPVAKSVPSTTASTPLPITQFGGEITPKVSAPPVVPPVVVPPPPPMPPVTLITALDVGVYILTQMTFSGIGPNYTPIGIAQVVNLENTWWVGLAGYYPTEGSDTGVVAAFTAGLQVMNTYYRTVRDLIRNSLPGNAKLILNGFSLGGMTCENVANDFFIRDRYISVVTYGSPITGIEFSFKPIVRFATFQDMVPSFTPLGLASWLLGQPSYTGIPVDSRFPTFPQNHTRFTLNPGLGAYDCWGLPPSGRPPFVLGPLSRYPVPG